jgi:hypothetical protein
MCLHDGSDDDLVYYIDGYWIIHVTTGSKRGQQPIVQEGTVQPGKNDISRTSSSSDESSFCT